MTRAAAEPAAVPVTIVAHDVGRVGGMERQLSELVRGLVEHGIEVRVVSRTCDLPSHPLLTWVRVRGPARPFALAYPWFFVLGSLLVWRHRRGVLHTTGAIVFNRADLSTVHFCHNVTASARLRRASRPTRAYRLHARVAGVLSRLAERTVYRPSRTPLLVAVSEEIAADLRPRFSRCRITTIRNGVDTRVFRPDASQRASVRRELGLADDDLLALFVGSEWVEKGLAVAVEAVRRADGWRLLVVGSGDPAPYSDPRVLFAGRTEASARYFAAADAFVFPSARESAPLVVYEAAASALPLLVTAVGGVRHIVRDGETGWVVDRDPDAVARRLDQLRDPVLRRRLGGAARATVGALDWRPVVSAYSAVYSEAAGVADHVLPQLEHGLAR